MNKQEFLTKIVDSIKSGDITILEITELLIPPKQKQPRLIKETKTSEKKKAYFKEWYEKNKEYVIAKEKMKYVNKKLAGCV